MARHMTPSFRLDGMTALVTGAANGIGARLAIGLAEFGADVGCVDVAAEQLEQTVDAVRALGRGAIALQGDVTSADSLNTAVERVESELGPLRLAVNSAGIHSDAPAEDMEREMWQRLVDVNLTGVFQSCQAEGRAMLRNGGGSIVNLASISATIANRGLHQAHYNATKAAIVQLSRSLALEWADRGIRVNALSPGYVRTGLSRDAHPTRTLQQYVDDIPLKRVADPSEMVGPAVFLLSPAASYCTASELVADGGAIAW
jgi:NAD(P)-dependent dehydrogenase (short-subunit alcohol dehydrogenase family)